MNFVRCTIVDRQGVVSFVAHGDALQALVVIFNGSGYTETVFSYRLPKDWALVP